MVTRFSRAQSFNACHGSDAPETAAQECEFFFGRNRPGRVLPSGPGSALGIIKPHAYNAGLAGKILDKCVRLPQS